MDNAQIQNMRALCVNIGAAIIGCQTAAKLINLAMQWLFPKEPIRTVDMLEHLEEEHRRKTLGEFIYALRARGGRAPDLDALLGDCLEHGNTVVHALPRVPRHTCSTH